MLPPARFAAGPPRGSCSESVVSYDAPGWIRTNDLRIRSALLAFARVTATSAFALLTRIFSIDEFGGFRWRSAGGTRPESDPATTLSVSSENMRGRTTTADFVATAHWLRPSQVTLRPPLLVVTAARFDAVSCRQAIPRTSPATGSDGDPASVVGRHVDVTGSRFGAGSGTLCACAPCAHASRVRVGRGRRGGGGSGGLEASLRIVMVLRLAVRSERVHGGSLRPDVSRSRIAPAVGDAIRRAGRATDTGSRWPPG